MRFPEIPIRFSAYPDGAGAMSIPAIPDADNPAKMLVRGLAPAVPLYFFATTVDGDKKESKPVRKVILKDEFPFK